MKKLILSMAALAMMLTSCNEKDVAVGPQTTTVNASFGFAQSSAMASASLDKDNPNASPFIGTTIYKKVPCNVYGFEVYARSAGQETVYNAFAIEAPDDENAEITTFELKNIFLGDNEFETRLSLNPVGVAAGTSVQFDFVDGSIVIENCKADINAVFENDSNITDTYVIGEDGYSGSVKLGHFVIVNGGAKITFNGNAEVGTKFIVVPADEMQTVSAANASKVSRTSALAVEVVLDAGGKKCLIINDNSFTDESLTREYKILAQRVVAQRVSGMSKALGISYEFIDQNVSFTLRRGYCPTLEVSFDEDFHMTINELSNVEISIDNFITEEPK